VGKSVKADWSYWQMSFQCDDGYMRKYKIGTNGFKDLEMLEQPLQSKDALGYILHGSNQHARAFPAHSLHWTNTCK
jgi:hypothetical protein